jgi:hypothetical protein
MMSFLGGVPSGGIPMMLGIAGRVRLRPHVGKRGTRSVDGGLANW